MVGKASSGAGDVDVGEAGDVIMERHQTLETDRATHHPRKGRKISNSSRKSELFCDLSSEFQCAVAEYDF